MAKIDQALIKAYKQTDFIFFIIVILCMLSVSCNVQKAKAHFNQGLEEEKKGNLAEAKALYKKACDGKEMVGCTQLGVMEADKGNLAEAKKYFNKACDSGDNEACRILINLNKK